MRLAGLTACLLFARPGLAADGDLDPTFGTGGKVVTNFDTPDANANTIALQPDGKIVAAGWLFTPTGSLDFAVARYRPDGSLDPTFDFDGRVRTDFFGAEDVAEAVAIQPDGKILAAGLVRAGLHVFFGVARYTADGGLDPTFDGDGRAVSTFAGSVHAMVLQPDGRVVVAGRAPRGGTGDDITLSRFNPDGTLDSTFGSGGTVQTDIAGLNDGVSALLLLPGGKLLAVGSTGSNVTVTDIALVRYNSDGSLDATFGTGGKTVTDIAGRADDPTDAALQSDGKIVLSAFIGDLAVPGGRIAVVRFLANGELDTVFGSGGRAYVTFPDFDEAATAVAIQADGKVIAAGLAFGSAHYDFALVRFDSTGTPDSTFAPSGAGIVTDFFGASDWVFDVLVQPDGKIVAGGFATLGTNGHFALSRYLGAPSEPRPSTCPRSYGFWRSHPGEWPVSSLTLGSQSYGTAELTVLLHSPAKGDASVILARQLIAAKLNLAAGAGSEELEAIVAVADGLLAGLPGRLPYDVSPSSTVGRELVKAAGSLVSATNRGAHPGCGDVKDSK